MSAIHHCRWLKVSKASGYYYIHYMLILFVYLLGIGGVLYQFILVMNRCAHDRISQLPYYFKTNGTCGNAYPDSFLFALEQLRDIVVRFEDKCKWPGKSLSQHAVKSSIYRLAEIGEMAQVGADKREVRFITVDVPDPADALHCLLLVNIAPHPVNGIRGINDHAPIAQTAHYIAYLSCIGFIGVDV